MSRRVSALSVRAAFAVSAVLVSLIGCGGSSNSSSPGILQVETQTLPGGVVNSAYSATLTATGGVPPYTWSISSGSLPAGVTLNSSAGSISGTPTAKGTSSFTAMVSDSQQPPKSASASLLISVAATGSTPITHVVVIFQENRSTDNLFQDPVLIGNGANIQNYGYDSKGNKITLTKAHLGVDYDPNHGHNSFSAMCDVQADGVCKMDGADLIDVSCPKGATDCPAPDLTFQYVDPGDVRPYFDLAGQYAFADNMFQTNQGPSFPAHQFIFGGTSWPGGGYSPDLFAAENPGGTQNQGSAQPVAGCDAVSNAYVALIDSSGSESSNSYIYPCFEHKTLADLLDESGFSWTYYTPAVVDQNNQTYSNPAIWNGPEAIEHICGPNEPPPNATHCVGTEWNDHVVLNQKQILTDIANNQLADVSWVIPAGRDSDHAGNVNGNTGPSWVAAIVNSIGTSPYWANTAIFITWDDWGGWYDHVAPPACPGPWGCGYVYGFRVPLIVVSSFAKTGYISHQQHDFGSILKYIEQNFGLPSLGYADAYADDLSDCFIYSQGARAFKEIKAPLKADFFLHDTRPPEPPDDD